MTCCPRANGTRDASIASLRSPAIVLNSSVSSGLNVWRNRIGGASTGSLPHALVASRMANAKRGSTRGLYTSDIYAACAA